MGIPKLELGNEKNETAASRELHALVP